MEKSHFVYGIFIVLAIVSLGLGSLSVYTTSKMPMMGDSAKLHYTRDAFSMMCALALGSCSVYCLMNPHSRSGGADMYGY